MDSFSVSFLMWSCHILKSIFNILFMFILHLKSLLKDIEKIKKNIGIQ